MRTITMHHRPSRLFVNSLFDSGLLEEVELGWPLLVEKAGCLGVGRFTVSPSSFLIIIDMVGWSLGSCCTHKRPIFRHFTNWSAMQVSRRVSSIKSNSLSSVHNLHAYDSKQTLVWSKKLPKHRLLEKLTHLHSL